MGKSIPYNILRQNNITKPILSALCIFIRLKMCEASTKNILLKPLIIILPLLNRSYDKHSEHRHYRRAFQ